MMKQEKPKSFMRRFFENLWEQKVTELGVIAVVVGFIALVIYPSVLFSLKILAWYSALGLGTLSGFVLVNIFIACMRVVDYTWENDKYLNITVWTIISLVLNLMVIALLGGAK